MALSEVPQTKLDGPSAIPAQLRALADEVEKSGDVRTVLLVVHKAEADLIDTLCYGYRPNRSTSVGLLEFAKYCTLRRTPD